VKLRRFYLKIAVLTLGIASFVCATEPSKVDAVAIATGEPFAPAVNVLLRTPLHNGENFSFGAVEQLITGESSWQLGPSVVVGYLTKTFFIGVFPQQWWSIGGEHGRPDTNQLNLQPIATIFFGEGWSFGYSGNILASWNAPSEDVWTVPIGLGLGKVVKLGRRPVKLQLAVQYMPVHPRISGAGVERAGSDHSRHSEADKGRAFPMTWQLQGYNSNRHRTRRVRQLDGLVLWRACRHSCRGSRVGCRGLSASITLSSYCLTASLGEVRKAQE
jgi:hypothetical protein